MCNCENVQNCCANCIKTENYTGFDDFYCVEYGWQRAEQYDCDEFRVKRQEDFYEDLD